MLVKNTELLLRENLLPTRSMKKLSNVIQISLKINLINNNISA